MGKYIILFLILSSCSSVPYQSKILLPKINNSKNEDSYIKESINTKIRIGEKGSQVFDFFYGPKGSYFIVVSSKSGQIINLNDYDISLHINDSDSKSPEVISLAVEDNQVISGFGEVREGSTTFELVFYPIDESINKLFKFNYKVDIKSFL